MGVCRTCTVVGIDVAAGNDEVERFEASFRRFAPQVHAYVVRRAGVGVAQDVTAETFLIAWRRRGHAPAEPLPWLYGIARGVLANERRSAGRRGALAARLSAQPVPQPAGACDGEILEALGRLSSRDREALLLTAWEGLSLEQAAAAMECSPAALAVRVHRGRSRLARLLAEGKPAPATRGAEHSVWEASA